MTHILYNPIRNKVFLPRCTALPLFISAGAAGRSLAHHYIFIMKATETHNPKSSLLYRAIRRIVWLFYPKLEVIGAENLPPEPALIVGNHAQMDGPISCQLYFPRKQYTWCAGEMMHLKDVPKYAFSDFWAQKPKCILWFYRLLSYVIAPLSVCVFNNADTIGVYHDARILSTFRNTVSRLSEGADVVIFPEHDKEHNHIINDFQTRFVDVAGMYHKKTGKEISFVPLYVAPCLKKLVLGKPIRYCAANPKEQERERICDHLMEEITSLACSLPPHTVVPYKNIPKRMYPSNVILEGYTHR